MKDDCCRTCRFFDGSARCRRRAPTVVVKGYDAPMVPAPQWVNGVQVPQQTIMQRSDGEYTVWPTVAQYDWCGEFERIPYEPPPEGKRKLDIDEKVP